MAYVRSPLWLVFYPILLLQQSETKDKRRFRQVPEPVYLC